MVALLTPLFTWCLMLALVGLLPTLRALPALPATTAAMQVSPSSQKMTPVKMSAMFGGFTMPAMEDTMAAKRVRRSSDHIIPERECVMIASEEGQYYFKGDTEGKVCGLYLLTDPDHRILLSLSYLDIPCATNGLLALFDGWELNREYFPSESEHPLPLQKRFVEFCSDESLPGFGKSVGGSRSTKSTTKRSLMSSQNAALVQYRVPQRSSGFTITVRFLRNPTPCNILLKDTSDVYTLRNYGKPMNCSLAIVFPAKVTVLSLSVGMASAKRNMAPLETGTIHKCEKRGMQDFVEVGGTDGLDTRSLAIADSICGVDSRPGSTEDTIFCGVTVVRLVSSGGFDNAITVALQEASEQDVANLVCGLQP